MRHRNVIRLFEVMETKTDIYMVMEYAPGGDLLSYMRQHRSLSEQDARKLFR
jgi:serine/threonine protein kinase